MEKNVVKREILEEIKSDQSSGERRSLRSGYLSIQNLIHEKKDEIGAANSENFLSIISEFDEMHHLVTKPREQVCDAEALRDLTNTLVASIRVHSTGSVTPSVFVSSLVSEYGHQGRMGTTESPQILWNEIGLHVSPLLKIFRGSCTMFGPMNYEVKPPKLGVGRKRSRSYLKEEKVKPEALENSSCKEKAETEKNIETMFDILRKKKNVNLEELILNRRSFAQTVENKFALSFLVKDGRVVIALDDKGCQRVSPRNAPASGAIMSGEVVYHHFIFPLDFHNWKLMKDFVAEGSELMPHRTKLNLPGSSEPGMVAINDEAAVRITPLRKPSRNPSRAAKDGMITNESQGTISSGFCKSTCA